MIFLSAYMEARTAIHTGGPFVYGTDTTLRAGAKHYDEDSERLVWLRRGSPNAVRSFFDEINELIGLEVAIVAVPSHDPAHGPGVGIGRLAEMLASGRRVNLGGHCRRHDKVLSLREQPERGVELHLRSITVDPHVFVGREVLLLDDLGFTGDSVRACRKLIIRAGAARVGCMVLRQIPREGHPLAAPAWQGRRSSPSQPAAVEQKTYHRRPSRVKCSTLRPGALGPKAAPNRTDEQPIRERISRARDTLEALQLGEVSPGFALPDLKSLESLLAAETSGGGRLSGEELADLKQLLQSLQVALSPVNQPARESRGRPDPGPATGAQNLYDTYGQFTNWGLRRRRS